MRFFAAFAAVFGVGAALLAAQLAPAQTAPDAERIALSGPQFPPEVALTARPPFEYVRSGGSTWFGPEYRAADGRVLGRTTMEWAVTFDAQTGTSAGAAAAALTRRWAEDQRGQIAVPHVVGARTVGTITGAFLVTANPARNSAGFEAAMAFPVIAKPQTFAVFRFLLLRPDRDDQLVQGSVRGSSWNRGQAFQAMGNVRLDGNLAPARVTIKRTRKRRAVSGVVRDSFGHPVVGAAVPLERWIGGSWRPVRAARTSSRGSYTLVAPRLGTYRAVAALSGVAVRSGPVTAGR